MTGGAVAEAPVDGWVASYGEARSRRMGSRSESLWRVGQRLEGMVGDSPAMLELADLVRRVARLPLPVLVLGESGTGKELVARAIHQESDRCAGPYVVLNAASLAPELAGSELFGHVRGAYTGALAARLGAFRSADRGTLFIDEIGALPLTVQAKLLRVVEDWIVTPVGSDVPVRVDVRIVAATCEPIEELMGKGAFRADLYHRLGACVVQVPALRQRSEDIPELGRHLLARAGLGHVQLGDGVQDLLGRQRWSGNVRELHNVLVQAYLRSDSHVIEVQHVWQVLEQSGRATPLRPLTADEARDILRDAGGNVSAAARRASLPRSTFRGLLKAADCRTGVIGSARRDQNVPASANPRSVGVTIGAIPTRRTLEPLSVAGSEPSTA